MRPSSLLVLIAAAGTALARSRFGGNVEEPEPTPCTVKAWVRAEDMKPNAVSHGELKVKVVQPCTDQVESVSIRLRLDEMSELSIMANTTSDGDFWDFSGATPSQEWTTTKHKRSAFRVEKTLSADGSLKSENWAEGVVFPFTVVSPNVNYPPAIFPLMFNGYNTESQRSSVGRLYRYIASVKLVTESGQSRTAEAPAGFSAFRPIEHAHKTTEDLPFQTSITAVETNRRWNIRCEEDSESEANSTCADTSPATLGLTVTLPEGTTLATISSSTSNSMTQRGLLPIDTASVLFSSET
ncbi:hypothetical protein EXIGLDRAFT_841067 [Exidia glandulosa HHB12029]|uniref:Arrestin-like N-terminal domain-containing protein n=1 Tax=Exidia glandulosa HHB12029 TaxID=1314781 RepID=A0A165E4M3_EXIGL|nr:hypothetical protein EXIGLDRAFT_841067 [Exidia glandulosa HHB12029]